MTLENVLKVLSSDSHCQLWWAWQSLNTCVIIINKILECHLKHSASGILYMFLFFPSQLSISRASSDSNFSSLDNLFLSVSSIDSNTHQSTGNLVAALTSPSSEKNPWTLSVNEKTRRISAPTGPSKDDLITNSRHKASRSEPSTNGFMTTGTNNRSSPTSPTERTTPNNLYKLSEEQEEEEEVVVRRPYVLNREDTRRIMAEAANRSSMIYSHSMEDLSQLKSDDDLLSPKHFEATLMSLRSPPE